MRNKLLIVSLDALNAKDLSYLQNLKIFRQFMDEGSYVRSVDSVYPSLTYCCHTSIITGTYPNPTVDGIRGRTVATTAPGSGQVLKWNGSAWAPADDVSGGGSVWQTSGSDIYYNTGDVGIGTTTPSFKYCGISPFLK